MNNNPEPYSWEELQNRRHLLKKKISRKENLIKVQVNDLFYAPPVENKFDQMMNYAKAGMNVYDGFMTGFKLLKSFSFFFHKKKK